MALRQARQFLTRAVPWPQGDESYVNLHYKWKGTPKADGSMPWAGSAARTLDRLVHDLAYHIKNPKTLDMYYCVSSQLEAEAWTRKGFNGFKATRSSLNAVAHKSFVIDLDVKPGEPKKGYETQQDLMRALGMFLRKTGLPIPTTMVASGTGGFHVYWFTSEVMTPQMWSPVANAFVSAMHKFGLVSDTQCTIDACRIMRVPDTFNYKQDPPLPVRLGTMLDFDYSLQRLRDALEPHAGFAPVRLPSVASSQPAGPADELGAGIHEQAAPRNIDSVARECAFIRQALHDGGASYDNPLWNLTTLVAAFCEEPVTTAHRMASSHKGYTPAGTDDLLARKRRERELKNLGWPRCTTIKNSGCTACDTCVHFAAGKSPLNFDMPPVIIQGAVPAVTTGVTAVSFPQGYAQNPDGEIVQFKTNLDGSLERQIIFPYAMHDVWLQGSPWVLHFRTQTCVGKSQFASMSFEAVNSKEALGRELGRQGMLLSEYHLKQFREFVVSWTQKLRATRDAIVTSSPFGWSVLHGKLDGFIFGGRIWTKSGDRVAAMPDSVIASQYSPKGLASPWVRASNMLTDQNRPALDCILASSFAAPLVRFTGQSGLLMSCYSSESGIGKSTAVKVAQSVWGDPIKAVQGLSDTQASVIKKIGETKNLPLYWDELKTEADTQKFINMVFQLSQGKEKSRMKADTSLHDPGTWQTLMVSASNDSILGQVIRQTRTTTAGIYRVFEFTVPPGLEGQIDGGTASRMVSKLNDNFGGIGVIYARWLGENHEQCDRDMEAMLRDLNTKLLASNDERFWIGLIACLLLGATYSNQLGLTRIKIPRMKIFLLDTLTKMRREINAQPVDLNNDVNAADILTRFLAEMRARNTLKTNVIARGPAANNKGHIKILSDTSKLDALFVHIGIDDKTLRITRSKLVDWLDEHKVSQYVFFTALEKHFSMTKVTARLGAGTDFAGFGHHVLEIDMAGTKLKYLADI